MSEEKSSKKIRLGGFRSKKNSSSSKRNRSSSLSTSSSVIEDTEDVPVVEDEAAVVTEEAVEESHASDLNIPCDVMFDFEPESEAEISVSQGSRVTLLSCPSEEWWEVERGDGEIGYVPAAFLKKVQKHHRRSKKKRRSSRGTHSVHKHKAGKSSDAAKAKQEDEEAQVELKETEDDESAMATAAAAEEVAETVATESTTEIAATEDKTLAAQDKSEVVSDSQPIVAGDDAEDSSQHEDDASKESEDEQAPSNSPSRNNAESEAEADGDEAAKKTPPPVPSAKKPPRPPSNPKPVRGGGRGRGRGGRGRGRGRGRGAIPGGLQNNRPNSVHGVPQTSTSGTVASPLIARVAGQHQTSKRPASISLASSPHNGSSSITPRSRSGSLVNNNGVSNSSSGSAPGPASPEPGRVTVYSRRDDTTTFLEELIVPDENHITDDKVDHRQRKKIVSEIYSTEIMYVENLREMVNRKNKLLKLAGDPSSKVDAADIRAMFSNVEQLLHINQMLLADLEDRVILNWNKDQIIGDVFVKIVPFLKMYSVYGGAYNEALKLLTKYRKSNPRFAQEESSGGGDDTDLEHLLIMPVQRVPRYNLLLRDFRKATPASHPDWKTLNEALASTMAVANHINVGIRQSENIKLLAKTSTRGAGFRNMLESNRQLIRDVACASPMTPIGYHVEHQKSRTEKMHFFLFNDSLVWALEQDVMKQKDMAVVSKQVPLDLVWLKLSKKSKKSCQITTPGLEFKLKFDSQNELKGWVKDLTASASEYMEAQETAERNRNRNESEELDVQTSLWRWGNIERDGGSYEGWFFSGVREGHGKFTNMSNTYDGEWSHGKRQGTGVCEFFNGSRYEGEWAENLPHGQGVWSTPEGDRYEGSFKHNERQGRGVMTWASGDVYEGEWKHNEACGIGRLTFKNKMVYEGHFKWGTFHGKGTLTMPNGWKYEGGWKDGLRHGHGQCEMADGSVYNGSWENDQFSGKGGWSCTWSGSRYNGEWLAGLRHGSGVMVYGNGSTYSGMFRQNERRGKGEMRFQNGDIFIGHWKGDRMHGPGTLTLKNGVTFEGTWEFGLKQGRFSCSHLPDGSKESHTIMYKDDAVTSHSPQALTATAPIFTPDCPVMPMRDSFSFMGLGVPRTRQKQKERSLLGGNK